MRNAKQHMQTRARKNAGRFAKLFIAIAMSAMLLSFGVPIESFAAAQDQVAATTDQNAQENQGTADANASSAKKNDANESSADKTDTTDKAADNSSDSAADNTADTGESNASATSGDQTTDAASDTSSAASAKKAPKMLAAAKAPASTVTSGCFLASNPNKGYSTISAAVKDATDGDTLYVVTDISYGSNYNDFTSKSLTITSASTKRTISVPYNTYRTQSGGTLALENITFATSYNGVVWNRRPQSMFTILQGGNLVMGDGATISFANNDIMINTNVDGPLGEAVRVRSGATFTMKDGSEIVDTDSINNAHIGTYNAQGGAVYVASGATMNMEGGTISGFTTTATGSKLAGGAIYNDGTLNMSGGTIKDCKARAGGGGVYNTNSMNFTGGTIDGCTTTDTGSGQGGGIYNTGRVTMDGSASITGCKSATGNGGGIYNDSKGTFQFKGGIISSCSSSNNGGGVYNAGTLDIDAGSINDCSAANGGAVYSEGATSITGLSATHCSATSDGGGIYVSELSGSTLDLTNVTLYGCTATRNGGGIYSGRATTLAGSNISDGSAANGGGVYMAQGSSLDVGSTNIFSNKASGVGSAIATDGASTLTFGDNTTIVRNSITSTSSDNANNARDCAVASTGDAANVNLSGKVTIQSNTAANGTDGNLSARSNITVTAPLDTSSFIGIHDGGSDAYKIGSTVATIGSGATKSMEQAQLFKADGGNATTTLNSDKVVWAGMCRIHWDAKSQQLLNSDGTAGDNYWTGGWKYYADPQAAIDDIDAQVNKQKEKTIEILVDHYEIKGSTTFYTYKVSKDKYVRITTSSTSEFNNPICTFSFPDTNAAGNTGKSDESAYCIFNVENGGQLTLDGRNGMDSAENNGLVFDGKATVSSSEMKTADAHKQAVIKNEGRCIINDVTFKDFNSRCDSNNNHIYGLITSYAQETGNKQLDNYYLELTGTTLIDNVSMYGGAVHEIGGGVGVYGGGFKIDSDVRISRCFGPTGGLALGAGATGSFAGTIDGCSTLGGSNLTTLSNQGGGGIFLSNSAPNTTGDTTLTVNDGTITNCVGNTDTPNVTASAGGIMDYGGAVKIHGITITKCSTNSAWQNAGGAMSFNTAAAANSSISMDGKCIVRDNTTQQSTGNHNLTLSSDTGASKTIYINVTGDMDPASDVRVWAQYGTLAGTPSFGSTQRNSADRPFAYAEGGDASKIKNLNTFKNDRDTALYGVASYNGWTNYSLNQASTYPAAIIWNTVKTVKATKRIVSTDGSKVTRSFTFKATSSAQGFAGKVYDKDGNVKDDLVTAYPEGSETDDSTFTLSDGDYVLFDNVPVEQNSSNVSAITIAETDGQAALSANPTTPYVCSISEKNNLGNISTEGTPSWSRPAGENADCDVTFTNTLRNGPLQVGKTLTGDYADLDQSFSFHMTLNVPDGLTPPSQGYSATVYDANGNATSTKYAFIAGTSGDFTLKNGQTLRFTDLPVGTTYNLSEDGVQGYSTSATVATLNAQNAADTATVAAGAAGSGLTITPDAVSQARVAYAASGSPNTVQVHNDLPDVPYTNVSGDTSPWILALLGVLAAAIAAVGAWVYRRKHKA